MPDDIGRAANLRDIGGDATGDGRRVRRGMVYRSAALSGLPGDLMDAIRALHIRTIVDLRHNRERAAHPTPWEAIGCADYWSRDHHDSGADLGTRLADPALRAEDSRAAMMELYAALPFAQARAYAALFRAVAAGRTPVLFHCAVGKDRTGVAAALILAALGVGETAIREDYLRTAQFDLLGSPHLRGLPPASDERRAALAPVLRVEGGYLDAMFAAIADRNGSIPGYLTDVLGLSADEIAAFRETMLAPA